MRILKRVIISILCYVILFAVSVNIFSGALGSGLILAGALPVTGGFGFAGNRLLMALAMPSFTGDMGYYGELMENDWTEKFYYEKAKNITGDSSDEYARLLSALFADEEFQSIDGYPIETVNLHPNAQGDNTYLFNGIYIRNQSGQTPDTDSLMREKLHFKEKNSDPLVLIYHTHTSESYNTTGDSCPADAQTHNTDNEKNVVSVGKELADALNALGISTLHCTDRLDESYNGAYDKSLDTVDDYLEKYPGIQIVIDMHRDAIIDDNNVSYRPVNSVHGLRCAQVMFIVGTGGGDYPDNPYFEDNFRFGVRLCETLERNCPGITRSLNIKYSDFNQLRTPNSILVEMGSCGNTLTEAKRTAVFLAAAIAEILYENDVV